MEPACLGRIGWARHVTRQHDLLPHIAHGGVRQGHRRQQSLCVRVSGPGVDLILITQLHQLAEIHHPDPIRDMPDD
jgi:hypothetical protein